MPDLLEQHRAEVPIEQFAVTEDLHLRSKGHNLGDAILDKPALNPFETDVRDTLTRAGLKLVAQYGSSGCWIDYAVAHPLYQGRFVLAIECDGATYHSSESARDRDRLRQEQLERLGWRFHRIWSSDWYYNKDNPVARVLEAYERAVKAADGETDAPPAPPPPNYEPIPSPAAPARHEPRPRALRRNSIDDYTRSELVALVRWIESDDIVRTRDELLAATIQELGFQRRGSKIVAAVENAIDQARR